MLLYLVFQYFAKLTWCGWVGLQGAVRAIDTCTTGSYVTGGDDGVVCIWDAEFNPTSKFELHAYSEGYNGKHQAVIVFVLYILSLTDII